MHFQERLFSLVPSLTTRSARSSVYQDRNSFRSSSGKEPEWWEIVAWDSDGNLIYIIFYNEDKQWSIVDSMKSCKWDMQYWSDIVQVRELFVMAREHAPSIIFMDEIDSIGSSRVEGTVVTWIFKVIVCGWGSSGGDSEVQRTMLELLNQLDGFEATKNIKVRFWFMFDSVWDVWDDCENNIVILR